MRDDYESDSSDGQQPRMIAVPAEEWERVQAQLQQAREVIEAVEWEWNDGQRQCYQCIRCKRTKPQGHATDCKLRGFLAALDAEKP